jgi:hypothetical protein
MSTPRTTTTIARTEPGRLCAGFRNRVMAVMCGVSL